MKPVTEAVQGVTVVREDVLAGGTKSRFMPLLFKGVDEICYASSHCGGGQLALASVAKKLGKRCTIVAAARAQLDPRQFQAKALGAQYLWIRPGYQSVIAARARQYAEQTGAVLAPFGFDTDEARNVIAEAASSLKIRPRHVWVSGGSGLLARALRQAWPDSSLHVVQVGAPVDVPDAEIHVYDRPYAWRCPDDAPFPADRNYELKTWNTLQAWRAANQPKGKILFWNACGT